LEKVSTSLPGSNSRCRAAHYLGAVLIRVLSKSIEKMYNPLKPSLPPPFRLR
jgi:hypothetical protein